MKRFFTYSLVAIVSLGSVISASAQIADSKVHSDFLQRTRTYPQVFEVFKSDTLQGQRREAMEVLYAYSPLPDLLDNSAQLFVESVDVALRARNEMPWGDKVSDSDFRHFVLPLRINNEAIDRHRPIIYDELKDRVRSLSMKDAILEINHWCHEKATYQPSDSRTHSPLATMYTAIGRCGEESTFTVAALRSMGIPARQVYTPRWAHTDDNHAWVEAWADGKWYFLGACEPEAVLNLGWFNEPASRGMLMETRVFGDYDGAEEALIRQNAYTDINVTANYAPTSDINVQVVDADGHPVAGADVTFRVYNYGEFYPVASKVSDAEGKASLNAGLGDLLVWASDGRRMGYAKANASQPITVVTIASTPQSGIVEIVPPVASNTLPYVSPEAAALNDYRKAQEDSIRGAYTATFLTAESAQRLVDRLGLPVEATSLFVDARANHKVLEDFIMSRPAEDRLRALGLLQNISRKDLSDVTRDILDDHIDAQPHHTDWYNQYVLSPRIFNESLTPFRSALLPLIPESVQSAGDIQSWIAWVRDNISTDWQWNPPTIRMSPESVIRSGHADANSRNILFVAGARTLGFPSRIDPVTEKPQYLGSDSLWHEADFGDSRTIDTRQGQLRLDYNPEGRLNNPKYYTHFTISKIVDGMPQLLNYPEEGTWSELFSTPAMLDEGTYLVTSGQRLADGSVLSALEFVNIVPDSTSEATLVIPQNGQGLTVIGALDAETQYLDKETGTLKTLLSSVGRGFYVLAMIAPNHEPSNHVLRDISALKTEFDNSGHPFVILTRNEGEDARLTMAGMPELPQRTVWGTDISGRILQQLVESLSIRPEDMPVVVIADSFGRVVFLSQGYTIGIGEKLMDALHTIDRK